MRPDTIKDREPNRPGGSRRLHPYLNAISAAALLFTASRIVVIDRYDECSPEYPGRVWTVERRKDNTYHMYNLRVAQPGECPPQLPPSLFQPKVTSL